MSSLASGTLLLWRSVLAFSSLKCSHKLSLGECSHSSIWHVGLVFAQRSKCSRPTQCNTYNHCQLDYFLNMIVENHHMPCTLPLEIIIYQSPPSQLPELCILGIFDLTLLFQLETDSSFCISRECAGICLYRRSGPWVSRGSISVGGPLWGQPLCAALGHSLSWFCPLQRYSTVICTRVRTV